MNKSFQIKFVLIKRMWLKEPTPLCNPKNNYVYHFERNEKRITGLYTVKCKSFKIMKRWVKHIV